MKNKYIYILLAFVCFFGFNASVNADYKIICQYEKIVNDVNQSNCRNPLAVVTIEYDQSNSAYPYRVQEARECPDDDTGYHSQILSTFELPEIQAQKNYGGLGNRFLLFHTAMSNNKCPSNVIFNKYNSSFLCFYGSNNGKNYCAQQSNISVDRDDRNNNNLRETFSIGEKIDIEIETGDYPNISNGDSCELTVPLGGKNTNTCYINFEYNNNDLIVRYSTSKDGSKNVASGEKFACGGYTSGSGSNAVQTRKYVNLTNTGASLHSKGVLVTTRATFNKKYLDEWNKTGECPSLTTDSKIAATDTNEHNFYLLFSDAAQDVRENGSGKMDANNFIDLKVFEGKWTDFIQDGEQYDSCDGLLGDDLIKIIDDILFYVRVFVPIILIALGLMDFVKAVIASQDDAMAKARNKFIKRLIMAFVIFLAPTVVNFLLNTFDGLWAYLENPSCSIFD